MMRHSELQELSAEYSLGALDGPELATFVRHLPGCWECRRRVQEYQGTLGAFALRLEPVAPSPQLKQRVLERVRAGAGAPAFRVHSGGGGSAAGARPRRAATLWPAFAAAACLMLALFLGFLYRGADRRATRSADQLAQVELELERTQEALAAGSLERERLETRIAAESADLERVRGELVAAARLADDRAETIARLSDEQAEQQRRLAGLSRELEALDADLSIRKRIYALLKDPAAQVLALRAGDPAEGASGRVIWNEGQLGFIAYDLPLAPQGMTYELWAIPPGGAPIPAGLFDVDEGGNTHGTFAIATAPETVQTFALTLEPAGGLDAPTGAVYLVSSS